MQRSIVCLSALLSRLHAVRRCAGYRVGAHFTMQCVNVYVRIVGWLSRGQSVHTTGQSLTECPCVRSNGCARASVSSRTSLSSTNASTNGRPKPAQLPVLRYTDQTQHWPKPDFLDSRVHTQIQQHSPMPCYNSESTRAQRPAGSVCAHEGDGRPYLAQGSSMQYNRRKQTQCACKTVGS